jgi:hypothetical protein
MNNFDREFKSTRRTFGVIAVINILVGLAVTGGIIAFAVWLVKYLVTAFT